MSDNRTRLNVLLLAIVAAAFLRLVPHPPNFTPIGAMALFSGAYVGRRGLAFVAPVGALFLSDVVLGFYDGMIVQYAATALTVVLGMVLVGSRPTVLRVGAGALASATFFFTVTNLGVWAFSGMYPLSAAGLAACFIAAVPFFQNNLAGDLVFSALLFGGWALAERRVPVLRQPSAQFA